MNVSHALILTHDAYLCLLVIQSELGCQFIIWSSQERASQKFKSWNQQHTKGKVQGLIRLGRNGSPRGRRERKGRRGPRDVANEIRREPRELAVT